MAARTRAGSKARTTGGSSRGFPYDAETARARSAASYDRSNYPIGMQRQLVAIMASGDRTDGLKSVTAPTVVIHGEADVLVTGRG